MYDILNFTLTLKPNEKQSNNFQLLFQVLARNPTKFKLSCLLFLTDCRYSRHEREPKEEEAEPEQAAHARFVQLLLLQDLEERDVEECPARHALEDPDDQSLHVSALGHVVGHNHPDDDADRGDQGQDHHVAEKNPQNVNFRTTFCFHFYQSRKKASFIWRFFCQLEFSFFSLKKYGRVLTQWCVSSWCCLPPCPCRCRTGWGRRGWRWQRTTSRHLSESTEALWK